MIIVTWERLKLDYQPTLLHAKNDPLDGIQPKIS